MIHIWVRKTLNWQDEKAFLAQLDDTFRPKVQTWNSTFNMPYHLFRNELKQIASHNLLAVADARISTLEEIPESAIVVPIDDDDWLAPEIAGQLVSSMAEGIDGCHWRRDFLEPPAVGLEKYKRFIKFDLLRRPRRPWSCSTNSYAFRYHDRHFSLLNSHVHASHYFDQNPGRVKFVDQHLSLMNRSVASQTALNWKRPGISRRQLLSNFEACRGLYDGARHYCPVRCWPYLKKMSCLMSELKPI